MRLDNNYIFEPQLGRPSTWRIPEFSCKKSHRDDDHDFGQRAPLQVHIPGKKKKRKEKNRKEKKTPLVVMTQPAWLREGAV